MDETTAELMQMLDDERQALTKIQDRAGNLLLELLKTKGDSLTKQKLDELHRRTVHGLTVNRIQRDEIIKEFIGGLDGQRD